MIRVKVKKKENRLILFSCYGNNSQFLYFISGVLARMLDISTNIFATWLNMPPSPSMIGVEVKTKGNGLIIFTCDGNNSLRTASVTDVDFGASLQHKDC